MKIQLQLKDIVRSDLACDRLGLSPWCVNEGADGDDWYVMTLDEAKECGLI